MLPQEGAALMFSSQDDLGLCDPKSEHLAEPPAAGAVKYVLQRWYVLAHDCVLRLELCPQV